MIIVVSLFSMTSSLTNKPTKSYVHSSILISLKEGEAAQRLSGAAVQLGVNAEEEVTAKEIQTIEEANKAKNLD